MMKRTITAELTSKGSTFTASEIAEFIDKVPGHAKVTVKGYKYYDQRDYDPGRLIATWTEES